MLIPTRYALTVVFAAVVLAGCSTTPIPGPKAVPSAPSQTAAATALSGATMGCGLDGADGVQLNAEATTLSIDTKGPRETSGAAVTDVRCVLAGLEVPSNIQAMMKLTTATDEPHEASWDGRHFSWSYDPATWFRLTITEA